MSAKENLTLWMEPELQAQAAALFNALPRFAFCGAFG